VGVVLFECLTGRSWSMAERPQDCDWSDVPVAVLPAVKKALAWHRDDRWPSAAQFRDALLQAGSAPKAKKSKLAATIGALVLVVALAVAGRMILTDGTPTTAPSSRIAVLPFAVRGNAEYEYLAEGLVDLLSTKLDGAGTWRSVDPRLALGVSRREGTGSTIGRSTGRDIAERLNADLYLLGSVVQLGQQLSIEASIYSGGEESDALIQASAEGSVDELLDILDDLSAKLLAAQPEAAGTRLSRIALVTSSSLPALKAYLRGVSYLRAARYQEAANAFQSAIVADSTFALAWYQLGIAADWLLNTELGLEATQRALQYADRLSERDRRLLEARGAVVVDADAVAAERLYRAIVGTYPTDVEAWSQLGELILHWGPRYGQPLEAAREPWIRLLGLEPGRPDALIHLARIEAAANDVEALDLLVRRATELAPEGDRLLEMRLLQSHVKGDVAAQEQVLDDFRQEGDGVIAEAWWSAGAFLDDPNVAIELAQMLTDDSRSSDARVVGYAAMASGGMTQGQWTNVLDDLSAMSELDPIAALEYRTILAATAVVPVDSVELINHIAQLREFDWTAIPPPAAPGVWFTALSGLHQHLAQYLIGLASARIGMSDQALAAAQALAAMQPPEGHGSLIRDWVRGIRATVAWRAGDIEAALAELEQFEGHVYYQLATASLFHTLAYERFLLARLLEESGRLEEALTWYDSFEGAGLHDRVFEAPAHWRRGHIYLQLGDEATAREHYMRLLGLWAEADTAFSTVLEDARRTGG
ncbi:MAG: hypothetical protein JSW51_11795, partial [Gemmatimonadota bacterium]